MTRESKRPVGRTPVETLTRRARENERVWSGFRRLELRLIGASSLRELLVYLATEFPETFRAVDCVSLACLDPEYEMARLLEQADEVTLPTHAFVSLLPEQLAELCRPPYRAQLGPCDAALQALLFPGRRSPIRSIAISPLVLRGRLIGCINQASRDPAHFAPDAATDLLDHLAAVTAMCIDNALTHERLKLDGLTDPLTRVANRRAFERRLREEVERWSRRDEPLACIFVDIDHFKAINDRHGHQVGDRVLQRVAQLLGRDLRATDVLARYGGEEFVLLLPHTDVRQAAAIAERLRRTLAEQPFDDLGVAARNVTASFGVAALAMDGTGHDAEEGAWIVREADRALYRAKHAGRNRVVCAASGSGRFDLDDVAAGSEEQQQT
jgi:two-component system cell cycle response regulator